MLDAWNYSVLAPVALGDGMTVSIKGVSLFLDPSNVFLGFQKLVCLVFFPFFFADCHLPASLNGTMCVPPGQSEPSRDQLCLQWGRRRVWVRPLCQDPPFQAV